MNILRYRRWCSGTSSFIRSYSKLWTHEKRLSGGYRDFGDIMENNCVFVDKTRKWHSLAYGGPKTFFLTRPPHFGKSVLSSGMRDLFLKRKNRFKGTWIQKEIDWNADPYPVLYLDFSRFESDDQESFGRELMKTLTDTAREFEVDVLPSQGERPHQIFGTLLDKIREKERKDLVIIINGVDTPISKNLTAKMEEKLSLADEIELFLFQISLRNDIRFLLVTSTHRFHELLHDSFLLGHDISASEFSFQLSGFSESEIRKHYPTYLEEASHHQEKDIDQLLKDMAFHYGGYQFGIDRQPLFNPFSVVSFFGDSGKQYFNHWYGLVPMYPLTIAARDHRKIAEYSKLQLGNQLFRHTNLPLPELQEKLSNLPSTSLTCLLHGGFLTVKPGLDVQEDNEHMGSETRLVLPNREIEEFFYANLFRRVEASEQIEILAAID